MCTYITNCFYLHRALSRIHGSRSDMRCIFCRHTGLFCGFTGLFCEYAVLFCRYYDTNHDTGLFCGYRDFSSDCCCGYLSTRTQYCTLCNTRYNTLPRTRQHEVPQQLYWESIVARCSVCCSVLQCVLQCIAVDLGNFTGLAIAVCCSVSQRVLQCVAEYLYDFIRRSIILLFKYEGVTTLFCLLSPSRSDAKRCAL